MFLCLAIQVLVWDRLATSLRYEPTSIIDGCFLMPWRGVNVDAANPRVLGVRPRGAMPCEVERSAWSP